jgi:hypothetical protein
MTGQPVEGAKKTWAAVVRGYKAVAVILLHTLVLFALVNLLCSAALSILPRAKDPGGWSMVPEPTLAKAYPDLGEAERRQLFRELAEFKFTFQPFTHFRARDYSGKYVNCRNGIRSIGKELPWPPRPEDLAVFVFGGSTAFGHSADHQTIAAYLQGALERVRGGVAVYNFGCVFYYSTQERILFEQLLQAGHVPRVAVFIDGLNDCGHAKSEVMGAERFQQSFDDKRRWPMPPVVKAFRALTGADRPPAENYSYTDRDVERVLDRYLANKKLIEGMARAYEVSPVFVWQPVPTYKLESEHYPFTKEQLGRTALTRDAYPRMAERAARTDMGPGFLWLADLQVGFKEPVYVDQVHYSPAFSKAIAEAIARFLVERRIVGPP